jgi:elongator complex protein 3
VQSVYDSALRRIERGHSVKDSIEATQILKDLGFKINYHMMPGLPGVDYKKDLSGLRKLFSDSRFRPDMLKIYPCMVLKGTKLYDAWKKKRYKPLTTKKAVKLIAEFKRYVPEYVRMMRVQRDIPTFMTSAGVDRTNLRQYIERELARKGIKCRCIRCREIGRKREEILGYSINRIYYRASKGMEFFIAAEKGDSLLGFCRLRFPSAHLRKEIVERAALVRELHVYGSAVQIGKKGKVQHKGIGKELLKVAEKIAKQNGFKKMVVISGVGAREYYRKLGYKKEDAYMVKNLK